MLVPFRLAALPVVLALATGPAAAATPAEIDAAIKKGAEFLRDRYKGERIDLRQETHGIGGPALAGLALLEAGTPIDDPALKAITAAVREASYSETQTYHT